MEHPVANKKEKAGHSEVYQLSTPWKIHSNSDVDE